MQLENLAAAGQVVQAIHILRDQGETRLALFNLDQRAVRGVWLRFGDGLTARIVPLPNQARVASEGFGRGQIFGFVALPKAASAAKSGDAALGGNACARQNDNRSGLGQPFAGLKEGRIGHYRLSNFSRIATCRSAFSRKLLAESTSWSLRASDAPFI